MITSVLVATGVAAIFRPGARGARFSGQMKSLSTKNVTENHVDEASSPAPADPEAALAWLETLSANHELLAELDPETLRRLREAAGRIAFPDRSDRRALIVRRKRDLREQIRTHDDAALDATTNRSTKRSLRFSVPPAHAAISSDSRALLEKHAAPRALPETATAKHGQEATGRDNSGVRLREPQNCYICKVDYFDLHHHYDTLCPTCADFNWAKRMQTADLAGRSALVTGARVKIGFEAAVMLLRAGASVVVTTRFPGDAARRFSQLQDFADWEKRLSIFGLDLRHTPSVEALADHLNDTLPTLDFLIHNACQTVRRPPAYYTHLLADERLDQLGPEARALVEEHVELLRGQQKSPNASTLVTSGGLVNAAMPGLAHAATLNQLDLLSERDQAHLFPTGILDGEGQQLDLRKKNSWRMNLDEVSTLELLEVQLVNSIAPFVLTARLKPLMLRVPSRDKHVVNVSAMEGQFYRTFKTARHPHTNMAKAALNMMTRTSAADFVQDGIHMNSVDTGWVTDEDPFAQAVNKEFDQRFAPPLDSIDGAARVISPIFDGFNTGVHCWGQFLKDYQPTRW
jgi:NAD(P)-dependent dehydrogenase (short-subunit alcohol dehydrogenase family)